MRLAYIVQVVEYKRQLVYSIDRNIRPSYLTALFSVNLSDPISFQSRVCNRPDEVLFPLQGRVFATVNLWTFTISHCVLYFTCILFVFLV